MEGGRGARGQVSDPGVAITGLGAQLNEGRGTDLATRDSRDGVRGNAAVELQKRRQALRDRRRRVDHGAISGLGEDEVQRAQQDGQARMHSGIELCNVNIYMCVKNQLVLQIIKWMQMIDVINVNM